jgi:nucleoside phosphorylase
MHVNKLWAVVVALPHEAKAFLPKIKIASITNFNGSKVYEGSWKQHPILLLQTGLGPRRAYQATSFLLGHYPVTHVVSTGYGGALDAGLKVGDGVVATSLLDRGHPDEIIRPNFPNLQALADHLKSLGFPVHAGRLLQSSSQVLAKEEKEELARDFKALEVDMESFAVLKAAAEKEKIASLALRFIVDEQGVNLPDTSSFLDNAGGVHMSPLVREAVRRPKILVALPQLDRWAKVARGHMEQAIDTLINMALN